MARPRQASAEPATPWAWAVAGACLGLVASLVLFAPARWLAGAIERGSESHVLLKEPRGTVWDGTAQLVLAGGVGSRDAVALPERLQWRIRPAGWGLATELQADCCIPQPWRITLKPGWTGASVLLADGSSRWPASVLTGLGTPWNTVQPEGQLTLSTQSLRLEWISNRVLMTGNARLELTDLSSKLSTLKPMGSYRFTLASTGPAAPPTLQLETIDGSLTLNGSGQFVGSRLRFDGTADAAPDRVDALSNLLNIIGRRSGARSIIKVG